MTAVHSQRAQRRWLVPEVVQTSTMDCGPAALKALLEGFHIPVSYGRLREACQTDVDGTSIDTIEVVANQLGLVTEQVMLPVDHVFLPESGALPAIVVVRRPDGALHFVVVWRRHGSWLQVMDPAVGRRWISSARFAEQVFRHELNVGQAVWREWAESEDFLKPLRRRMAAVGANAAAVATLEMQALEYKGWFALAALDASTRLVNSVVQAGGIARGTHAANLLAALFERTCNQPLDIFAIIPRQYWSVTPGQTRDGKNDGTLDSRGAVLLPVSRPSLVAPGATTQDDDASPLSPELAAALSEKPANPMKALWDLLRADGILGPLAVVGAMSIAVGATLMEALLFRGIFDIGGVLRLPGQRLAAVACLLVFVAALLAMRLPIAMEVLRFGRHLETRLRMALLAKLPRLTDRYFHSRPVSDMADRSHSIHMTRQVPATALQFVQSLWEILFTLVGVILVDPASTPIAVAIVVLAMAVPLVFQPLLNERDLRVRNHAGALHGFYLDALLGLVPIRTHRAEPAVRRRHEALLVEWMRSSLGLARMGLVANGIQSLACVGLAGYLLVDHFLRARGVGGGDLLLVYWTLKLPGLGSTIADLAHLYPAQRNVLLRLLEPLAAPEELHIAQAGAGSAATASDVAEALDAFDPASHDLPLREDGSHGHEAATAASHARGVAISIDKGSLVAGGHTLLDQIQLRISPGEHVAIVGLSGAGKSTLLSLMLGWHRLASGQLLVDGMSLTGAHQDLLRRQTAWVDPAIQIWNRSFLENITCGSEDDGLARMAGSIDAANLRDILHKLPHGLQTWLGEGGALLSGGEGQRVRLGRALLQTKTRLVLLDEPFRGMDRTQRAALLAEATQWWRDVTLLCVTHDVSETRSFNRVLVVEGGKIVEDGSPLLLAHSASRYRELLDAEARVREQMWQGKQWRRIALQDGFVASAANQQRERDHASES